MSQTLTPARSPRTGFHRLNGPYHALRRIALVNNWHMVRSALHLAVELHDGQTRKAGGPYIHHPIRVALKLLTLGIREEHILAAALLHDVLEDCEDKLSKDILLRFYSQNADTVAIVHLLTKQKENPDDPAYFDRIATRWEATLIKLADRADNLATMNGPFTQEWACKYVEETRRYVMPLAAPNRNGNGHWRHTFDVLHLELQFLTSKAEQDFNLRNGNTRPAHCRAPNRTDSKTRSAGARYFALAKPRTSASSTPYGSPTAP